MTERQELYSLFSKEVIFTKLKVKKEESFINCFIAKKGLIPKVKRLPLGLNELYITKIDTKTGSANSYFYDVF